MIINKIKFILNTVAFSSYGLLLLSYSSTQVSATIIHHSTIEASDEVEIHHPFPQRNFLTYKLADGDKVLFPTNRQNDDVITFYDYWKKNYIAPAGFDSKGHKMYRVKFGKSGENAKKTVSEGQGYGMLITVIMAGYDPMAQEIYDGLWHYVESHPSTSGSYEYDQLTIKRLMGWMQPVEDPENDSSAFDGDADIALSLVLADTQWGHDNEVNYSESAKNYLEQIRKFTVGKKSYLPLLGNWVDSNSIAEYQPRSSDFMMDNFQVFSQVDESVFWNQVISNIFSVIQNTNKQYNSGTGLLPDFYIADKKSLLAINPGKGFVLESENDGDYSYNAARDPWRLGIDALLNNRQQSLDQVRMLSQWIRTKTKENPNKIKSGYHLNGNALENTGASTAFIAPFGVAAMAGVKNDSANSQKWLDEIYEVMKSTQMDYYEDSINLLCLMILTGNYWNPMSFNS